MNPIFTIGYSGISQEEFIAYLSDNECGIVCDVRSYPISRYRPEFSRREFKAQLNRAGIKYVFFGEALGARPKDRACYQNGVADYDLIAQQEAFQDALRRLAKGSETSRLALVCSEADPIECHRAILVAKHLRNLAPDVRHIHSDGKIETHTELEDRLIELFGTAPPPLLRTEADRASGIKQAYQKQSDAICYSESTQWKNNETFHDRVH